MTWPNHPLERVWDDGDIPRHTAQLEAIKRHGSLAVIELGHSGARCWSKLEVAGGDIAVALRFSVAEPGRKNGLSHDGEGREVVTALAEFPDLWEVNISGWPNDSGTSRFTEEGFQLPYTDFVKSLTTKPVVGVGRFTSPDMMVSLVKNGQLDLIGAARPSVAECRPEPGGRLAREAGFTGLSAWGRVKDYRLYHLQEMGNVSLYPESDLAASDFADFDSDHIFVATGSNRRGDGFGSTRCDALPGLDDGSLTPDDIMDGAEIEGSVVIHDDDHYHIGSVLAAHLRDKGVNVALVCPLPIIGTWMDYLLQQPRADGR